MSPARPAALLARFRGLASLSPGVPPRPGLRTDEWAKARRRCGECVEGGRSMGETWQVAAGVARPKPSGTR